LQPLDSYTVTGRYAKSSVQLYAKEIAVCTVVFLVFLILLAAVTHLVIRKLKKTSSKNTSASSIPPVVTSLVSSFGSALAVVVYTIVLMFLLRSVTSYLSSDMEGLLIALLLVVSFGIYGFLVFAAPILIGIKRGLVWGAVTLGCAIGWIIVFIVFMLAFFFITRGTPSFYPPAYPMRASSGVAVPQAVDMMEKATTTQ
jgi:hypothetical protein